MRKPVFYFYLKLFILGIVALQLQSCATNPVTGKSQLMLLSKDQEIALGAQSDPEIVAAFTATTTKPYKASSMKRARRWHGSPICPI